MEKQRSLIIFEESIKSENTKHVYHYLLEKFKRWAKVESFDDLLKADEKSIQRLVEDYVIHLKNKVSPNSFSSQLSPIILFFMVNDVNLNTVRLKKMYPEKIKRGGYGAYTKQDIQTMLDSTSSNRTKAIILILSSSGYLEYNVHELLGIRRLFFRYPEFVHLCRCLMLWQILVS